MGSVQAATVPTTAKDSGTDDADAELATSRRATFPGSGSTMLASIGVGVAVAVVIVVAVVAGIIRQRVVPSASAPAVLTDKGQPEDATVITGDTCDAGVIYASNNMISGKSPRVHRWNLGDVEEEDSSTFEI